MLSVLTQGGIACCVVLICKLDVSMWHSKVALLNITDIGCCLVQAVTCMQVQVRKMEQQLHQKEDMGEVLHVVDFDQLKIENQQYLDRIEERNSELLSLKNTTGKAVQVCLTFAEPHFGQGSPPSNSLKVLLANRRSYLCTTVCPRAAELGYAHVHAL